MNIGDHNTADGYADWRTRPLPEGDWVLRTGNKIGRNLYIEWPDGRSEPIGQADTTAIAALICDAVNQCRVRLPQGVSVHNNHANGNLEINLTIDNQ